MRYVRVSDDGSKVLWGDEEGKKFSSHARISDITSFSHGAKSSVFFKQKAGLRVPEELCFSLIFKDRTLDLACRNPADVVAWAIGLKTLTRGELEIGPALEGIYLMTMDMTQEGSVD